MYFGYIIPNPLKKKNKQTIKQTNNTHAVQNENKNKIHTTLTQSKISPNSRLSSSSMELEGYSDEPTCSFSLGLVSEPQIVPEEHPTRTPAPNHEDFGPEDLMDSNPETPPKRRRLLPSEVIIWYFFSFFFVRFCFDFDYLVVK